jgi:hypothetical protein
VGPTFILQIEFCEPVTIALTRKKKKKRIYFSCRKGKSLIKGKNKIGKKRKSRKVVEWVKDVRGVLFFGWLF